MLNRLKRINVVNLIISVVFLGCWYALYSQVRLAADDYMYVAFSGNTLSSVWDYYFIGNGRLFINLIETLLIKLDRYALVVICPPMMVVLSCLISRLATMLSGKSSKWTYAVSLTSLAAIDVLLAQEVFYWLSGAVTYLFSSVMFAATLIIFLYLKQSPDISRGKKIGLIILCFICSLSMEQFSLISTGFIFVALVQELVSTKRIKKLHILIFVLCAIATLSTLIAPASLVRLGDNSSAEAGLSVSSLITSLMDAIFFNYSSSSAIRFVLVISILELALFIGRRKIFWAVVSGVEIVVVMAIRYARIESFILVAFGLVVFLAATLAALVIAAQRRGEAVSTISLLVLAYMSQVFMLIGNLHHDRIYRISYTVVIAYIILAAYFASKIDDIKTIVVAVIMLLGNLYIAVPAAVIASVILLVVKRKEKPGAAILALFSVAVIAWSIIPAALSLAPYARLADYNEAQLRSGSEEIVIHCVEEEDMEVIYYSNYLVRISDENLGTDGGYYAKFFLGYEGSIFRNYYGVTDEQVVRIEYIDGSVSDFLKSVGY